MTPESLEIRLEEWAQWAQGSMSPVNLGYSKTAAGFTEFTGSGSGEGVIPNERQAEVEAAIAQLYVMGHGQYDGVRKKWIVKAQQRYTHCAEVLRAHYRAHPAYGDARFESPGNALPKTLKRIGISEPTYYRKLATARKYLIEAL